MKSYLLIIRSAGAPWQYQAVGPREAGEGGNEGKRHRGASQPRSRKKRACPPGFSLFHPTVAVRKETVQRNLDKAVQRRAELKLAEEKRWEAERLAAMERQRQEEEPPDPAIRCQLP